MKFKVGDKVRLYGNSQAGALNTVPNDGLKGEVTFVYTDGWINVSLDMNGAEYTVHRKQCRKLIRKKNPEIRGLKKALEESLCPPEPSSVVYKILITKDDYDAAYKRARQAWGVATDKLCDYNFPEGLAKELGFK